ncbi:hypothetical protein, partial [Burkholderia sp. SIMBA_019]|uniref:hypothetical protein n=1 Tax=Burkholderia sp. SIMBA_019 TaxID=3085765 RepID=UPI00397CE249
MDPEGKRFQDSLVPLQNTVAAVSAFKEPSTTDLAGNPYSISDFFSQPVNASGVSIGAFFGTEANATCLKLSANLRDAEMS